MSLSGVAELRPPTDLRYLRFLLFNVSKVLRCYFHKCLWRGKTDHDRRISLLRVHDYGLGRLHIHELVLICSNGFKQNSYDFFGAIFITPQRSQRSRRRIIHRFSQISGDSFKGKNHGSRKYHGWREALFWRRSTKTVEADDLQRRILNARDDYQSCNPLTRRA